MTSDASIDTSDLPKRCAAKALRVMPSFNRWATTQVVREGLGGDLSLRQLTVLYMIRDETPTLGHVARRLMVTPAVVTGIVDRLEKRGFVQRRSDTDDRRVVRLLLTEAGRAKSVAIEDSLVADVSKRLGRYPLDRVAELERGLTLLDEALVELERERRPDADLIAADVNGAEA